MRIVIDTNCLLRILPKISPYRCLWEAFLYCKFELCCTTEILQEYEEVLSHFYSPKVAEFTIGTLAKSKSIIEVIPYYKWYFISVDPDDNKFVDCAISANADFIVTNDKHFNILKEIDFPRVDIIDIDTFKKIMFPI